MTITKEEAQRYSAVLNISSGLQYNPVALARLGLLSDKSLATYRKVNDYLQTIKDPVQRYGMRVALIANCTPEIAATVAVNHYERQDPTGSLKRMLAELISAELNALK